jgi:hypothetical protein
VDEQETCQQRPRPALGGVAEQEVARAGEDAAHRCHRGPAWSEREQRHEQEAEPGQGVGRPRPRREHQPPDLRVEERLPARQRPRLRREDADAG